MTVTPWSLALVVLLAFVLGSIPFAYIIGRFHGLDIREHGSHNPGASNVFRVVGPGSGILAFVFDAAKGAFAVAAAGYLFPPAPGWMTWYEILLGLVAMLAHIYTPWLGFRGGKGVATLIGVLAVLFPLGLIAALICGIIAIRIYGFFSIGSLIGVTVLPITYFLYVDEPFSSGQLPLLYLLLVGLVVTFIRHRDNIQRLLQGNEHRLRRER